MSEVTFRAATSDDDASIRALLSISALPADDVAASRQTFIVAVEDGGLQGSIALEFFDGTALVRSLAVRRELRGTGLGGRLFDQGLELAADQRIRTLSLLTTSAQEFFARRGFEVVERSAAPKAMRESREFADLCPTTAVCMMKRL
jgi:amino-acid N-acetyltransferase